MGLTRINTRGGEVVINDGRGEVTLTKTEVDRRDATPERIKDDIEAKSGRVLGVPFYYHKNRDGSIAIATGAPPMTDGKIVWPEDQKPQTYERGQIS